MASLKAIRNRIVSVKNTRKITRAMKLVAAAKLRRAQDTMIAARPSCTTGWTCAGRRSRNGCAWLATRAPLACSRMCCTQATARSRLAP